MSGRREISRFECPGCGECESLCVCDYSGGVVEVWYVPRELAEGLYEALVDVLDRQCDYPTDLSVDSEWRLSYRRGWEIADRYEADTREPEAGQ